MPSYAMHRFMCAVGALVLCSELANASGEFEPRSINVALKADWRAPSVLETVSEAVAMSLSESAYWRFMDALCASDLDTSTDEEQYRTARALLTPGGEYSANLPAGKTFFSALNLTLSMRYFAPRAEMFTQLARTHFIETAVGAKDADAQREKLKEKFGCGAVLCYAGACECGSADAFRSRLDSDDAAASSTTPPCASDTEIEFDHVDASVGVSPSAPRAILYADITSPDFRPAHVAMRALAAKGRIRYVLRPGLAPNGDDGVRTEGESFSGLSLPGFGVELMIKSQEYKVLDDAELKAQDDDDLVTSADGESEDAASAEEDIEGFFFKRMAARRPELAPKLRKLRSELLSAAQSGEGRVQVWDIQDLGVQAVGRILRAQDPLKALASLCQSFPMHAPALARSAVNATLKADAAALQKTMPEREALAVNSVALRAKADPIELHDAILTQSAVADRLRQIPRVSVSAARSLLALAAAANPRDFRLDAEPKNSAVVWLNDISSGQYPYGQWSQSVEALTGPGWPNQLRYVAKNLYRLTVVFDPTEREGLAMLSAARSFVQANAPVAVGVVVNVRPAPPSMATSAASRCGAGWDQGAPGEPAFDEVRAACGEGPDGADATAAKENNKAALGDTFARLFRFFSKEDGFGPAAAFEFAASLHKAFATKPKGLSDTKLRLAFRQLALKALPKSAVSETYKRALKDPALAAWAREGHAYATRKGLDNGAHACVLNGRLMTTNPGGFQRSAVMMILGEQQQFQRAVYEARLTDETDIDRFVSDRPGTYTRLDAEILAPRSDVESVAESALDEALRRAAPWGWLPPQSQEDPPAAVSHVVLADFGTAAGRALVAAALAYRRGRPGAPSGLTTRIAILDTSEKAQGFASQITRSIDAAVYAARKGDERALEAMQWALGAVTDVSLLIDALQAAKKEFIGPAATTQVNAPGLPKAVGHCDSDCAARFGLRKSTRNAVVTNGRLVQLPGVAAATRAEIVERLRLLDAYSAITQRLVAVAAVLDGSRPSSDRSAEADRRMRVVHAMNAAAARDTAATTSAATPSWPDPDEFSSVIRVRRDKSLLRVRAVVDPLSETAQSMSAALLSLRDLGADITLFLSPNLELSAAPLKRFYRSSVSSRVAFGAQGAMEPARGATFAGIRSRALLTMNIDTPGSWLVGEDRAPLDLDNIMLKDLPAGAAVTRVRYKFENALIEGQCLDADLHEPPAGLQLQLGSVGSPRNQDTLVMYNLGYYQLKAAPGVWRLRVAPNRHSDIFRLEGVAPGTDFKMVPVGSLRADPRVLTVRRRPGMEAADLMEGIGGDAAGAGGAGLMGQLMSMLGGQAESATANAGSGGGSIAESGGGGAGGDTVHVFSLASGQLYERFLRIMMQSVVANTKSKVKFWFLSNFLSPEFKSLIPAFAASLNCDVELVTYKWPKWLRGQTEKQRKIWGYKILFLDVLFPLDLKRIIYIDADQVVRGDVRELWDMDLGGAPYGYTPFCDSNKKTDGFRFWASGYWKNHLQGRPYHISALYVVDLDRFRKLRAGDTLRSIYDNLSQDPNSLANLDQDLPNYAQHSVPIKSLPQEWLWCETWCSMETLPDAKTIDLCNNPLTKTPKLQVARELIPEWVEYDAVARNFSEFFSAERARRAAGSTDSGSSTGQSVKDDL